MLKIEVTGELQRREVKPEGKPAFVVHFQEGWAWIPGNKYPQRIELRLSDAMSAYKPGVYQLDPSSFRVGRFDSLELARELLLKPLDAVRAA